MHRHDTEPKLTSAAYMGHDLGTSFHTAFAIRMQRAYFTAAPPQLQRETLRRVLRIIVERPNSYLARHWRAMYGITTELWRCSHT